MLILGPGAVARADGAAVLKLAAKIAADTGMIGPAGSAEEGGWNGFNVLHTAASRVGGDGSGLASATARHGGILDGACKGEIDFVYLLGADEFDMAKLGKRLRRLSGHAMAMPARIAPM